MAQILRIVDEQMKNAFEIPETDFINIMKLCYSRNKPRFEQLKRCYEHILHKKFDYSLIGVKKK